MNSAWEHNAASQQPAPVVAARPIELPTWEECSAKEDARHDLDPLERFIYENTPAGPGEDEHFRQRLTALIEYVKKES